MKYVFIMGILALLAIYSCTDSGLIESNKIVTPLENDTIPDDNDTIPNNDSTDWFDHTSNFNYDSLDVFDCCFYNNNIILGCTHNILIGTDWGKNWSEVKINSSNNEQVIRLQKLPSGVIYALSLYRCFKSIDGGETWTMLIDRSDSFDNQFVDFYFTDENKGFIFGVNKKNYMTTNSGNTWAVLPDAPDYNGELSYDGSNKLYIINQFNQVGIFDINTRLFTSEQIHNTPNDQIFRINSTNDNLWCISLKSIYHKKSISSNWEKIYSSDDFYLYDLFFLDENIGYGIFFKNGNQNELYIQKSTDGGKSWKIDYKVTNPKSGSLMFVKALTENKVVAGGATYIVTKPKP